MKEQIFIAGSGGQGVVLAGSLLANTAMEEGLETCGMISYGAEMRGGTSNSSVIISDKKIGSPVVVSPDTAIIMNQPSLEKFEDMIKKGGLLILNISECKKKPQRTDIKIIEIEATKEAQQLGNKKIANLILIGAYLRNSNILSLDSALNRVKKVLPKSSEEIIVLNKKALQKGAELCS